MQKDPYVSDTGLLIRMIFDENGLADKEIYEKILTDKLEVNLGIIMENVVAQMITASGNFTITHQTTQKIRTIVWKLIFSSVSEV